MLGQCWAINIVCICSGDSDECEYEAENKGIKCPLSERVWLCTKPWFWSIDRNNKSLYFSPSKLA